MAIGGRPSGFSAGFHRPYFDESEWKRAAIRAPNLQAADDREVGRIGRRD
jgi:hypothetical protein